jgi:nucleotide-binding universal stress UspA family protein
MRWKASRSQPVPAVDGSGPADNATVVIGIDDLSASWDAFCWACREARRLGGRVVVAFVGLAARTGLAAAIPSYVAGDEAGDLVADMLREAGDVELTFIDAPGDPVTELLHIAREVHADLLVVSTSARAVGRRLAARRRESVVAVVPSSSPDRRTTSSGWR